MLLHLLTTAWNGFLAGLINGTARSIQVVPAKGQQGLIRSSSMSSNGRVKLGSFVTYKLGDLVLCDMAEIRVDDSSKLLIRLENARSRSIAAA